MNYVEPIRDGDLIRRIENDLEKNNKRNYIMFILGIHSGLRISDILSLRVRDVKNKDYIVLREMKTKKHKKVPLSSKVKTKLKVYCKDKPPDEYLIKSREGYNQPIGRVQAYNIMKDISEKFNIDSLGCHSLRKTFGYYYYKNNGDVVSLQKYFNHADKNVTLRYIGIEQEAIDKKIKNLKFY